MRDDDDARYDERSRRDNIMQQRLRRSRGEEDDDDMGGFDAYEERPRGYSAPRSYGGGGYARGGGGCATATLYLVLGSIVALLIVGFFANRALGGLGNLFNPPSIAQILNTPTPKVITGAAVVQRIQQLSRLETTSYTVEQVIEIKQDSNIPIVGDFLAGDALLLIAHGTVVAGVDLSTLPASAVTVSPDGKTVTMQLPPAQIFSASLDSQKTRVYSRERGLFAPDNKDLETLARQQAEQQILQAACEDGILSRANQAAEASLTTFLGLAEFEQVVVTISPPVGCSMPGGAPAAAPTAPLPTP